MNINKCKCEVRRTTELKEFIGELVDQKIRRPLAVVIFGEKKLVTSFKRQLFGYGLPLFEMDGDDESFQEMENARKRMKLGSVVFSVLWDGIEFSAHAAVGELMKKAKDCGVVTTVGFYLGPKLAAEKTLDASSDTSRECSIQRAIEELEEAERDERLDYLVFVDET